MKTRLLLLLACAAIVLGASAAEPATDPSLVALRFALAADAFTAVQQELGANAAEAISGVDERRNAVALNSTHPHAAIVRAFLTGLDQRPSEIRGDATTVTPAEIAGVGVALIDRRSPNEPLRIGSIIPGSPAERAGIKPDSFLISVDGRNTVTISLSQAALLVRGPVGTSVTLELADAALSNTNKLTVKRGKIVISKNKVEVIEK
jgi:C-terminal processing protease CtpA/Prc